MAGVDYCPGDGSSYDCTVCGLGQTESTPCTTSTDRTCSDCFEGFYISGQVCAACPSGALCAGGSADPVCASGYYSTGPLTCAACPSGAFCAGGSADPVCASGYYSTGPLTCAACPLGASCAGGTTDPVCVEGHYYESYANCAACPTGGYCAGGTIEVVCQGGYYSPSTNDCAECPIGSYCLGNNTAPVACHGAHTTTPFTGASASDACVCTSGYGYKEAPVAYEGSVCTMTTYTCVVFSDGRVKCWGSSGELFSSPVGTSAASWGSVPYIPFPSEDRVRRLACSYHSVCALLQSGKVKCFGKPHFGQLGHIIGGSTIQTADTTEYVPLGADSYATSIAASRFYSYCVTLVGGAVKCWGRNDNGELGLGHTSSPVVGTGLGDDLAAVDLGASVGCSKVLCARAVSSACCAVCVDPSSGDTGVKCWGSQGQWLPYSDGLARGALSSEMGGNLAWVDFRVGAGVLVAGVYSGEVFCALFSDHSVKCWGFSWIGAHGDPGAGGSAIPTPTKWPFIELISRNKRNFASLYEKCGVLTNGQMRCWGENSNGQNGVGHTNQIGDQPYENLYEIGAIAGYSAGNMPRWVTTTFDRVCAVTPARSLECWGSNYEGLLGGGDISSRRTTPFAVDLAATGAAPSTICAIDGVDGCSVCPPNEYKSAVGDSTCLECPLNTESGMGSTSIFNCTCKIGYYGLEGGECAICPANTYKDESGPAGSCTLCPAFSGTLGGEGSTDVADCVCDAGTFGPAGGPCLECPVDMYNEGTGQTSCSSCPGGSGTNGLTRVISAAGCECLPGHSGIAGAVCNQCPSDTYKAVYGDGECIACAAHATSPGGSTVAEACACGFGYSGSGWLGCTICPSGTYKNSAGNATCAACPTSSTSSAGSDAADDCLCIGDYYGPAGGPCTFCPAHSHAAFGSNFEREACVCEMGYRQCNSSLQECVLCERGYYCPGDEVRRECPASLAVQTTLQLGSSSPLDCVCRPAYFGAAGLSTCTTCPVDEYCPMNSTVGIACPGNASTLNLTGSMRLSDCFCEAGHYSVRGLSSGAVEECTPCDADMICPGHNVTIPCPNHTSTYGTRGATDATECVAVKGYYLQTVPNIGAEAALICPRHHFCAGGEEPPTECPPHGKAEFGMWHIAQCTCAPYYKGVCVDVCAGMCRECDANSFCPDGDLRFDCPIGTESFAGSASHPSECSCLASTYGRGGGNCTLCEADFWCPGDPVPDSGIYAAAVRNGTIDLRDAHPPDTVIEQNTLRYHCPENTTTHGVRGKTSLVDCTAKPGYYVPDVPPGVALCPVGSWCAGGLAAPVECLEHSSTAGLGSTNMKDCLCDAYYRDLEDDDTCELCPAGVYCPPLDDQDYACPVNTSSREGGAQAAQNCFCLPGLRGGGGGPCSRCPRDAYCPGGATIIECRVNTWSPEGSDAVTDCLCDPSYYGLAGGPCTRCPVNSWCVGGDNVAAETCAPYSTSPPGSDEMGDCVCQQGYYATEVPPAAHRCELCPENHWCPLNETVGQPVLKACPNNSISHAGSTILTSCFCGAGFVGRDGHDCDVCPEGEVCAGGNGTLRCPSFSTVLPGASTLEECICDPGYYGYNGDVCSYCTAGGYCPGLGNLSIQSCLQHMTSDPGSDDVLDCYCVGGYYETERGAGCQVCPEGSYCGGDLAIFQCPPNQTTPEGAALLGECRCQQGTFGSNGVSCAPCPEGHYCPGGLSVLLCPENSLALPGSSGVGACVCVLGYSGATALDCTACDFGYYCPGGDALLPCPLHANTTSKESHTFEQCTCEPGRFMNQTTRACDLCRAGYYCSGGGNPPTACPFASDRIGARNAAECACPFGSYREPGSSICTACRVDHYCNSGTIFACPSGSGTMGALGKTEFTECICYPELLRVFTPTPERICVPCPDEHWCDGSNTPNPCSYLLACAPGVEYRTECNRTSDHACLPCTNIPDHAVAIEGSLDCRWQCDAGYYLHMDGWIRHGDRAQAQLETAATTAPPPIGAGNATMSTSVFAGTPAPVSSAVGLGLPNSTGFLSGVCVACEGNETCAIGEYRLGCEAGTVLGGSPGCLKCDIPPNGRLPAELYSSGILETGECAFACNTGFFRVDSVDGMGHCCSERGAFFDAIAGACKCLPGWVEDSNGNCLL